MVVVEQVDVKKVDVEQMALQVMLLSWARRMMAVHACRFGTAPTIKETQSCQ